MNEHEAEKRIRQAVTEKTAFLDGLPSREKEKRKNGFVRR